jgi:hypothetical protein
MSTHIQCMDMLKQSGLIRINNLRTRLEGSFTMATVILRSVRFAWHL